MVIVTVVGIIIVFVVLFLAVITTSKAYSFKHTIDPVKPADENNLDQEQKKA